MRGIVFSSGTNAENYQAAFDADIPVFAAYFAGNPPEGTTRIADPVGPFYVDGKTWAYEVPADFEELVASLNIGAIVDIDMADVYPPVLD